MTRRAQARGRAGVTLILLLTLGGCTPFDAEPEPVAVTPERAAEDDPALRVVLITGFAAVALRANDEAPPGAQVLSKPIHLRELVNQVDEILAA